MKNISNGGLEEILERLAISREDGEAWEQLFRGFRPWVFSTVYRMLRGERQLAEDATQDVFLRLIRYCRFQNLQRVEAFKRYVYTVCRNVAHDYISRLIGPGETLLLENDVARAEVAEKVQPQHSAMLSLLTEEILQPLEEHDRLFMHMVIEGYDLEEIARKLELSYGTAAVRLHRIRNRLRKYLKTSQLS